MRSNFSALFTKHFAVSTMATGAVFSFVAGLNPFSARAAEQRTASQVEISHAQPPLPTETLVITTQKGKRASFVVEKAITPKEQEVGEMFRKTIPENYGMLFVWKTPHESAMWMKNTNVPLDIVFIDETQHIRAIEENTIPLSEAIISSHGIVGSVLELPAGTTEKLGILVGDKVESPSLGEQPH